MSHTAPRWLAIACSLLMLGGGSVWLFASLGHYALWCDEADTVLFAQGILRTGDTSAWDGRNLYAYRDGSLLGGLNNRYTPPLPYYLAAGGLALGPTVTWGARLPFALCGLACVAIIVRWLWRDQATAPVWVAMTIGLLGNVSFWLYARQGRYYALAMLSTLAAVYLYQHATGSTRRLLGLTAALLVLLATQYLNYLALVAALAVDYLVFRRRQIRLTPTQWLTLLLPQVAAGAVLASIWNPLGRGIDLPATPWWTVLWWNLRDLQRCELGVVWIMLLAPLAGWLAARSHRTVEPAPSQPNCRLGCGDLTRGPVAALVYLVAVSIASPPAVSVADVRYLAPLLPLTIALTCLTPLVLTRQRWLLWLPIVLLASTSNLLHFPLRPQVWRCTTCQFAQELATRRTTSVMAAADWIRRHVPAGETVVVYPAVQMYPLMVHAPQAVYGWQLADTADRHRDPVLGQLPDIHFVGREPPDWLVLFGPVPPRESPLSMALSEWAGRGVDYRRVALLDVYWQDHIRPELFWRSFAPRTKFDRELEAVAIFRRESTDAPPDP